MEQAELDYPKLRNSINVFPVEYGGKPAILLQDRLQVAQDLVLPLRFARFLTMFNGENSLRDIQAALMREGGFKLFPVEHIEKLVHTLNTYHYLDNNHFHKYFQSVEQEFKKASFRSPFSAGKSYSDDPGQLREEIRAFFTHADGPGDKKIIPEGCKVRGIIGPHIDFYRGGPCYAWAYQALAEACDADLFIILGTAHSPTGRHYVITDKDFETPLGMLRTDKELVNQIVAKSNVDLFAEEIIHRAEHSIEFQAVWLQYLYADKRDIRIIPILCGPLQITMDDETSRSGDLDVFKTLDAVRSVLRQANSEVCIIASADLTHMGPQFGDPYPIREDNLLGLRQEDLSMLTHVLNQDPEGFLGFIRAEKDRRKICGLPPIYTLLNLIEAHEVRILRYEQAYHPQATVTFASIGFLG